MLCQSSGKEMPNIVRLHTGHYDLATLELALQQPANNAQPSFARTGGRPANIPQMFIVASILR